ncbi:MAG: hypothetical protein IID44_21070, partial [Planctomycetes bacterium]|nr:hypothetical protein [Planctomycetota bacterium]
MDGLAPLDGVLDFLIVPVGVIFLDVASRHATDVGQHGAADLPLTLFQRRLLLFGRIQFPLHLGQAERRERPLVGIA